MSGISTMHESVTLSLTGNKTSLCSNYFPPIEVYEDSEIALLCLQTYNLFPNINETNNRIRIQLKPNDLFHPFLEVELETGRYEIEDIEYKIIEKIHDYVRKFNITVPNFKFEMKADPISFRCYLNYSCEVDFNVDNSLASVLGFQKRKYSANGHGYWSESTIDINHINSIKVLCSIAEGSYNNNTPSHSVYEFFPIGSSGTKIVQTPPNLIYYPLNTTTINSINIELVDQEQKQIQNFKEKLTVVLHIKRSGS